MANASNDDLPVAVIGAGPIGLVAAAHLVAKGMTPLVLEAGPGPATSIRTWAHVRLFSPWKYMVDPVSRGMLEEEGWTTPDGERLPTGGEFVDEYLEPLAKLPGIASHIRYGHRVVAVTRLGFDKVKTAGRDAAPFEVVCHTAAGEVLRFLARAVIDASGTWTTPNPMGASGVAVAGEAEQGNRIFYGIPDVLGRERYRYAGKRTLVVGSGHSAFNTLLDLAWLKLDEPGTEIAWTVRRQQVGLLYGGGSKDALPARGTLGARLRQLVEIGVVEMVTGFHTTNLVPTEEGILVNGARQVIGPVDEIVVAAGCRPDLGMLREVRLGLDPALECPIRLAPLIDPNHHSCGTVYPHGYLELQHPEADFYIVGMKSYGRAPSFLLLTGYEQVRSVVSALAGDLESARNVELVLPETGVCSSDGDSGCCSSAPQTAELAGAASGSECGCG